MKNAGIRAVQVILRYTSSGSESFVGVRADWGRILPRSRQYYAVPGVRRSAGRYVVPILSGHQHVFTKHKQFSFVYDIGPNSKG